MVRLLEIALNALVAIHALWEFLRRRARKGPRKSGGDIEKVPPPDSPRAQEGGALDDPKEVAKTPRRKCPLDRWIRTPSFRMMFQVVAAAIGISPVLHAFGDLLKVIFPPQIV